ncbi:glycosyltransferase family 4 protein [Microvirga massiliensis]|uniref:glycosyltransferase family 4 protein n=1 Tax=Microvirga massiliensis TaxID=1033741 RepID=UPI00164EA10A|nr:glycosyltransferase family 4 protein [Microvirga massiliensis]
MTGNDLLRCDARRRATSFGCPEEGVLVGFVGNFWSRKRPRFFLEVCARLASSRPDCYFVMFGRNGEETADDLLSFARDLRIADRVTWAGFRLPGEQNIAAIDLLLATALDEPFGRTLVEAAALGTPYLATDDAGHREIWARWGGGGLAPVGASADEFALLALSILRKPEAVILSSQERDKVKIDVSASLHARRIMEIYHRLETGERGTA